VEAKAQYEELLRVATRTAQQAQGKLTISLTDYQLFDNHIARKSFR
jgi:hypothetical protein